jgi:hypothetical protein
MRHGADLTIERLTYLSGQLGNCRAANNPKDMQDRWLRWWSEADSQLRNLFSDGEMAASLYVSSERVRAVNMAALPNGVLNHEVDTWVARFEETVEGLKALKPFIERPGQIVVPDTSLFLEAAYFTELDWQAAAGVGAGDLVRVVVPVLVIEELDDHKRGRDRVQGRARSVLRRLWELNGGNASQAVPLPGRPVTVEVLTDDSWHVRRPVNDNEIIERALAVGEITGRDVILAAADYSMLYQASAAGLKTALVSRPEGDTEPERPAAVALPAAGLVHR